MSFLGVVAAAMSAGCASAPSASLAGRDINTTLPAYVRYRFDTQSAEGKFALPAHPSIACAAGSDCVIASTILTRLHQEQASFSRIGQMEGDSTGGTDATPQYDSWGQPVGHFSAGAYNELCTRAAAQGYDLVVVCQESTFEVHEGLATRTESLCGGGIIEAKSGIVVAPIQITETDDGVMVWTAGRTPGGKSDGKESIDETFADQVVKVLKDGNLIR